MAEQNLESILKQCTDSKLIMERWENELKTFITMQIPSGIQAELLLLDAFKPKLTIEEQLTRYEMALSWLIIQMAREIANMNTNLLLAFVKSNQKQV